MENRRRPLLLLKTKSVPTDTYEEVFSTISDGFFAPTFVPVLEHRFRQDVLDQVKQSVVSRGFVPKSRNGLAQYGAMIFTSQRAVEAFIEIVEQIRQEGIHSIDDLLPETLPLYVVGPATARGLRSLNLQCPILGEGTGNGEVLAGYILDHYNSLYHGTENPPILFLVGDKRRDIIPRTLQSDELDLLIRSEVHELVIYETVEMESFRENFMNIYGHGGNYQWIVVFSPSGCRAMLEIIGVLDPSTGKVRDETPGGAFVATIGPTTRDYLVNEFGYEPAVCAERPSPEGLAEGIFEF